MVLMLLLMLMALVYVTGIVINVAQGTYETLGTHTPAADASEAAGQAVGRWMALVLLPIWSGLTLLWAPLNVFGLWRLRQWGRISTLVYSTLSLFTCCCMPFGIYTLVSLMLPSVRALFEGRPISAL